MVKASHIVTPDLHVSGRFYSISWTVCVCACVCAQLLSQSCPTLCNPMDCSPPGSSVHGISRQEYWNGWPFPASGALPDPGIEPASLAFPALPGEFFMTVPPGKSYFMETHLKSHVHACSLWVEKSNHSSGTAANILRNTTHHQQNKISKTRQKHNVEGFIMQKCENQTLYATFSKREIIFICRLLF